MKCRECEYARRGWFKSVPEAYVCIGVKEPFVISNYPDAECTEYPEKRNNETIEDAINHFKYGITHDIFSEPVTSYAKMAVRALENYENCKHELEELYYDNGISHNSNAWGSRKYGESIKDKTFYYCTKCGQVFVKNKY